MFLNLSHHHSAAWTGPQRLAAQAISGEIADLPFPDVPPDAPLPAVHALGDDLIRRILTLNPTAAMVQGEFTLAFYLVNELELRGIRCYAATTRRVVESSPLSPDRKVSSFEFVQFRPYR